MAAHRPLGIRLSDAARGIFDYVRRDLTSPEGAFYSAEDADSEGEEGRFYVWTPAQIEAVLGPEDAALFCAQYDVTAHGNFEHGMSIPRELHAPADAATAARLESARAKLLAARAQRPRPHLDDKVLAAWNGLMISAFARGARAFDDASLAEAATRAAEFVWSRLFEPAAGSAPATLRRRWREGEAASAGQLDDHAYLAYGFIDLYRATFDPLWLERAVTLATLMVERFADDGHGGFFESPAGDPHLDVRMKSDFDGAENSGVSIAALVLLCLGRLLDRRDWLDRAERTLALYAARLDHGPIAMPQMLVAMDAATDPARHLVVAGARGPATRAFLREFDSRYSPEDLLLWIDGDESRRRLGALAPFTATLAARDAQPTAFVCFDYACRLPITDPNEFAAQLDALAPARPNPGVSV